VKQLEEDRIDLEQLRTRVGEDSRQIKQLEGLLESKDRDIAQLTEVWRSLVSGGQLLNMFVKHERVLWKRSHCFQ